jgi:hypothetical protein
MVLHQSENLRQSQASLKACRGACGGAPRQQTHGPETEPSSSHAKMVCQKLFQVLIDIASISVTDYPDRRSCFDDVRIMGYAGGTLIPPS